MKNIIKIDKKNIMQSALTLFLFSSILAIGLFHEWTSCVASVLLSVWLFFKLIKDKNLTVNINLTLISVAFIVLMYGISAFWALDRGMAVIGFFKFLPVLLFTFCLYLKEGTESLIKRYMPIFMGVVVIVSAALMQIPALKDYFSVAGRFSGTFQYPNSFAIVVLVAQLLAFSAPVNKYFKAVLIAVLLFGIFYTGSRTVLVLAVLSNAAMLIYRIRFSKKTALISSAVFAVVLGVSLTIAFLRISPFDRILTINFGASTFIGRLLYFRDSLPVILKHPFGIGYLGYFYSQTSFQTGIYSVKYIHNDILQLAIDIGWLPASALALAVLKSIFSKGVKSENRIILSCMFLHCLFDFDLQFISVFMLLIVFMKRGGGKQITIKKTGVLFSAAVLSLLSLYFSVALALSLFGNTEASRSMYPYNTDNNIKMLLLLNRTGNYEEIADSIIEQNEYAYVAYGEKARGAYYNGDFTSLIKYKNLVFEYAPLNYNEYEEYCYMLINGVTLYNNAADRNSAEICKRQILLTKKEYQSNLEKVSSLGLKIKDKPKQRFPDDIETYIYTLNKGED